MPWVFYLPPSEGKDLLHVLPEDESCLISDRENVKTRKLVIEAIMVP